MHINYLAHRYFFVRLAISREPTLPESVPSGVANATEPLLGLQARAIYCLLMSATSERDMTRHNFADSRKQRT